MSYMLHIDEDDDTPYKETYWITPLNQTSVKSQYQTKFTLINKPEREDEIKKWLLDTFGYGKYIYKASDAGYYYAEIFFRDEFDATMFVLQWGKSFT